MVKDILKEIEEFLEKRIEELHRYRRMDDEEFYEENGYFLDSIDYHDMGVSIEECEYILGFVKNLNS